jgi:VWFA-related protein
MRVQSPRQHRRFLMKNPLRLLACWLGIIVTSSAAQLPQTPPPTFRIGVDAVQLDVSVLDAQRRPVRGLTAADFTVLEDGKPRRIVQFSAVELPSVAPVAPTAADSVQPDVVRNDLPEGRLVVIVLDPFLERTMVVGRVTMADQPGLAALRATARRVVDSLGPGDLTAVVHTIYGISQNFTTDKTRLKRAIDSSAFGTVKRAEGEEWGSCECGVCRVDALTSIATALRDETQRRKTVFFIGEHVPLAPVPGTCNTYLEPATKALVRATQLANVTVHTIDPNTLETTNVHAGDDFRPDRSISQAAKAQEEANRAHLIERQQSLQTVAEWTGGRAILNTNNPEQSVRSLLDESSAYYLVAFETSDVKPDGRFHPVTVKVNRENVQVRTRKGFYAEPPTAALATGPASFSVESLSRALLPERGVAMSIATAAFRGLSGMPVVVVTTGVRAGAAAPGDRKEPSAAPPEYDPIEILTSALRDGEKRAEWQRQRLSIVIPDGGAADDLRYESISTLSLKPGRYEVRVASRQERAGVVGSVFTYVDVPDFESQPVTLSGLVLLDSHAPTATPPAALAGVLDTSPTTRRDFKTADDVAALVRVYQLRRQTTTAVTIMFRVLDGSRRVMSTETALSADRFRAGTADARYPLPLTALKSGAYVLRVEASAPGTSLHQDLPFTVR